MVEFAMVLPLFLLTLLGTIDAGLWSLETSAAVSAAEQGVRVAVSATDASGRTSAATSATVASLVAPQLRTVAFATDVRPWPAGVPCPTSADVVRQRWGDHVLAVCAEPGSGGQVSVEVVGSVASLVPPAYAFAGSSIPVRVGAVSQGLLP
ncbi:MAG: TadE/TadG family type IV pilus assembly protein [Acidimicrobiales bacterium]